MNPPISCAVFLLLAQSALACANFSGGGTKYDGSSGTGHPINGVVRLRRAMERRLDRDGAQLEAALRNSTNFNDRSDYAIGLMYLGRSEEAVALLEQLEKEKPGEYFIAANLGTAYELSGNNSKALQWIKEGIRRNPKSHEGTEWLHVKILEAKISGQSDPTYFEKHSVLELDPAKISNEIEIAGQRLSSSKLAEAIEHQLGERMQFVKPPNPAVASLLFDYAAIEAVTHSLESAKKVFALANKYGYPRAKIDPLIKDYDQRIFSRKLKNHGIIALIGIGLVGLLVLAYKRGIFVLSRGDLRNPC